MAPAGPGASLDPPDVLGAVSFPAACSLIGKVAADHSHKWVFQETQEHEINLISSWTNPADSVSVSQLSRTNYSQTSIASFAKLVNTPVCLHFAVSEDMGVSIQVWHQGRYRLGERDGAPFV